MPSGKAVAVPLVVVIVILVVALVGVLTLKNPNSSSPSPTSTPVTTPYSNPTTVPTTIPTDFTMSFDPESGTLELMQGSSRQILISLNDLYSEEVKPTFSANTGSSGIQCVFSSASWFQEWLTINVPTSTPTGNYEITVTATNGQTSHHASYHISVLSAQVQVSGTVHFNPSGQANGEITPSSIQFTQLVINSTGTTTGLIYAGTITGNSVSGYSYSITVPNGEWYMAEILDSSGTRCFGGQFNIGVPAGSTSITKNLSYP